MKMDNLQIVESQKVQDIISHAYSVQQPRSNFQLEKFVLGQHDSEPMQFYQLCIEISESAYHLRIAALELEKMYIRLNDLLKSNDRIDQIDAKIMQVNIEKTESVVSASIAEFNTLLKLYDSFSKKYTREDIENDQETYWVSRLRRQAALEEISVSTSQSEHFNSLRQVGLLKVTDNEISWQKEPKRISKQITSKQTKNM
jgi:hypothetical protein